MSLLPRTTLHSDSEQLQMPTYEWFKGIVQQDLTWVETRLKRSVLMNYIVAKFAFEL
jgi:hypothetical protein